MSFQIHALPAADFADFFALSDQDLAAAGAKRMTVQESPGTPCRVSLSDAQIGETVILLNYEHQPGQSPYRSRHAIYVREGAHQATPAIGEVPDMIASRLISLRGFDAAHMMIEAEVVEGRDIADALEAAFENEAVSYVHLHIARPGCFAACVTRPK
ncbi:MAG: DUF1203 domain-containing protein [Pseudomonadota bacterium]